jgi:hypothetical protein
VFDENMLTLRFALLLHDHGIRTFRDGGAGEDPGRRTRLERLSHFARTDALRDSQPYFSAGNIRRANGITVHGAVVERWHVHRRMLCLGEDTPGGFHGRNALGIGERAHAGKHPFERLVYGKEERGVHR